MKAFLKKFNQKINSFKKKKNELPFKVDLVQGNRERKYYLLKIDIELLESKINHTYQQLGKIVYKKKSSPLVFKQKNIQEKKIIAVIDKLKKEILLKKRKIKENK